jgi:type II secretory pathway predicted ATPase ExeA
MCIDRASGPAVAFGQSGWGKSQLLAVLQRDFKSRFRIANVTACTRMSRRHDLLQNILFELGQPYREMSEGELRLALIDYLKPNAQCPNGILLLVDDAQLLPFRLLDELRMISNFVREGQSRVRLVLAGTQALEEKLAHPQLESLNQRIASRCYLQPFRRDEVGGYIRHQVIRAGCPNPDIFQPSAVAAVQQLCEGNPRTINQVCDHALILAASCGLKAVTGEIVAEAFGDIQRLPVNLFLPTQGATSAEETSNASAESSIIEFGQIDDAETVTAEPTVPMEPTIPIDSSPSTTLVQSIDRFAQMVDALADIYCEVESDEERDAQFDADNPSDPAESGSPSATAGDPFAEAFDEEVAVTDRYAKIAAQQNRAAAKLGEAELRPLEHPMEDSPTFLESPIIDDPGYCANDAESVDCLDPTDDSKSPDDRDMLVVTRLEAAAPQASTAPSPDRLAPSVTRGLAVRMEYGRLFQQLRGSESPGITSTRK